MFLAVGQARCSIMLVVTSDLADLLTAYLLTVVTSRAQQG